MAAPPGTGWLYSSGDSMVISEVIAEATGMPAAEFAQARLFAPIGMEQIDWWQDVAGHTLGYCCLDATAGAQYR